MLNSDNYYPASALRTLRMTTPPALIAFAIDTMDARFKVVRVAEPVLDLSSRGDISSVAEKLKGVRAFP